MVWDFDLQHLFGQKPGIFFSTTARLGIYDVTKYYLFVGFHLEKISDPKNHGISKLVVWSLEIPEPCYTDPNPSIGGSNDS